MADRRYTDRDVAVILRRAVELDEQKQRGETPHAITIGELRDIATEVGIDPTMVDRAAAELEQGGSRTSRVMATETAVVREVRSIPGTLDDSELRELIWAVDRAVPEQGTVTEALGEVRWTASGRLRSTQVSVKPTEEETLILVEASLANTRGPLLGIPASWGAVLGFALGADGGVGTSLMLGALLGIAGFFVGGGIWQLVLDHHINKARALMDRLVGILQLGRGEP